MTIIVTVPEASEDFRPDVLIIPGVVAFHPDLQPLDVKLYGVVYWLEHMRAGKCTASNATLAKIIKGSSSGVAHALERLRAAELVFCTYDADNQRTGINTLVRMRQAPYSNEQPPLAQMSNRESINKTKDSPEFDQNVQLLYRLYLREMVVGREDLAGASVEERRSLIIAASKRYRLTEKRRTKVAARLKDLGLDRCKKALINLGKSDFHRGENDNGWKAELDWVFGSFEKAEEWANREQ